MKNSRILMPHTKQTQGFTPAMQYSAVNAAREKRKRKAHKRAEQVLSGGWANIPIIRANS